MTATIDDTLTGHDLVMGQQIVAGTPMITRLLKYPS